MTNMGEDQGGGDWTRGKNLTSEKPALLPEQAIPTGKGKNLVFWGSTVGLTGIWMGNKSTISELTGFRIS